jgi:4a-hydroxytetrahydrobiopterin dehydratase
MPRLLDDEEITRQLAGLPAWQRDGPTIRATFEAPTFLGGIRLVDEVADLAEAMNHHPDIDVRWTRLTFALSTHSVGGLTQLDIELAHQITAEADRAGATAVGGPGD